MLRLRQHADRAAEQVRLVGVALEHHVGAGMIGALGQVDALDVGGLSHAKTSLISSVAIDCPPFASATVWPGLSLPASSRRSESDRNGPGVELAVVLDDRLVEHAVVGGAVHRPVSGRQPAVAEAVDARQIGVGDGHLGQLRGVGDQRRLVGRGDRAGHGLGEAAVGRDQIGHRWWSFRVGRSRTRQSRRIAAAAQPRAAAARLRGARPSPDRRAPGAALVLRMGPAARPGSVAWCVRSTAPSRTTDGSCCRPASRASSRWGRVVVIVD